MSEEKKHRVLIADDEEAIRTLMVRVLSRAGFEPAAAVDGRDAIEQLNAGKFDVIVLDLMMPRVDGFGVVDHLISTQPHMMEKTVIMTAFPRTAIKERMHHLCTVISKPFEIQELIQHVRHCAEK